MTSRSSRALRVTISFALALAALWLSLSYLLPILLAAALSTLLEPLTARLSRRIPRSLAAGACVISLTAAVGGGLWLLLDRLIREARSLALRLPEMMELLSAFIHRCQEGLSRLTEHPWARALLDSAVDSLLALPGQLSAKALALLPKMAEGLPEALLFTVTVVLGTYFISAGFPALKRFALAQLGQGRAEKAGRIVRDLKKTLGSWIKAQLIMSFIIFAALTLAFALLGIDYPLLTALVTALIDALPVLGAGTVLLPWAAYQFLAGGVELGVGLTVTYAAVTLLRSCLQAKLLGDQLGLHPLITLIAVYLGWRLMGIWGMILFPILAVSAKQLNDSGVVRLWKDTI